MAIARIPTKTELVYPESDGKPMTETDLHRVTMMYLIEVLDHYYQNDPTVYVSGNLMFYYEEGNPAASVSPDVFVVKGVRKGPRRVYKLWEEGKAPEIVFELTSRSTRLEDLGNKRVLYASLGIREYFIFDPLQEYLRPALQAYRLEGNEYGAIKSNSAGRLPSSSLNLDAQTIDNQLRLWDPRTNKILPTFDEAQAEIKRLRSELKKLRGEPD